MRILLIVPAFIIFLSLDASSQIEGEYRTITVVEQMPMFDKNGSYDFLIWVYQNIKYPDYMIPIEFNIKDQLFIKKIKEFSKLSNKNNKQKTKQFH
jgi:hypothetical protein